MSQVFGRSGKKVAAPPAAVKRRQGQRKDDEIGNRPPPRLQHGNSLHFSQPIVLIAANAELVPEFSGVFMLLRGNRESDAIFIGGSKNLREEFYREIAERAQVATPKSRTFTFAETQQPWEQADREIASFRRRFGFKPELNSIF